MKQSIGILALCFMTLGCFPAKEKVTLRSTFESGLDGWTGRGGSEVLSRVKEGGSHGGTYALKVENRSRAWHGPSLRIEQNIHTDASFDVSLWVKLISPARARLQLSTQTGEGEAASYHTIAAKDTAAEDGWVELAGNWRWTSTGGGFVSLYVEAPNDGDASFFIDDVTIKEKKMPGVNVKAAKPLKLAYKNRFLLGNAASPSDAGSARFDLLTRHFNVATAENAMKPEALQKERGVFTFDAADTLTDALRAAGLAVHGHTLVWHQQSPAWMNTGVSAEEARENLVTHIQTVAAHFKGRVISWDVVNEAVADNPPAPEDWQASLRESPWRQALGSDYIELAFKTAREADPGAKLYYNDYNLDNPAKALAVYTLVKELNEKNPQAGGRPLIDGIGMQGHYRLQTSAANVERSLERFASLGVRVSITELDVQAGEGGALSERQALEQGMAYARLFTVFNKHAKSIERVTFWGLDDGTSWRAQSSPLLFDKQYQPKPAFTAVADPEAFLARHSSEFAPKQAKSAEAAYGTPSLDGAESGDPWDRAESVPINQYLMAWQGARGEAKALWDERYLYVRVTASGARLNKASPNAYEHDSVEVFVDENNAKTSYFEDDDGQYRVNFANEASFNPASIAAGFASRAAAPDGAAGAYTVTMAIPWKTLAPQNGTVIGFDAQINGASASGARESVAVWNDLSGNSYQDCSGYGTLRLVK